MRALPAVGETVFVAECGRIFSACSIGNSTNGDYAVLRLDEGTTCLRKPAVMFRTAHQAKVAAQSYEVKEARRNARHWEKQATATERVAATTRARLAKAEARLAALKARAK